tara:strand:+ start:431 stop:1336 length:906 start_codon:yes stop_codon:yes gene_type:complete
MSADYPMKTLKAISLSLGELASPVITQYQIGLIIHTLYREKHYKGQALTLQKETATLRDVNHYITLLEEDGVISSPKQLPDHVYTLLGRTSWSEEDVLCSIDPFCYLSHFSAMAHHGLTERVPIRLFVSSPGEKDWRHYAEERMRKDLGEHIDEYLSNRMPRLVKIPVKSIGTKEVHRFNSLHLGAYRTVRDRPLRVSSIGRTFLDMLRNPDLCGGMRHVVEVYEEHAERYLRLITDEINQHGHPIDKVRAGYILDERLGLGNSVINDWKRFAQRGGTRKLDPTNEYEPQWSDHWLISLNL